MKSMILVSGTVSRIGDPKKNDQGQISKYVTVDYEGGAINAPCSLPVLPPVGSKVNIQVESKMETTYLFKRVMAVAVPQVIVKIEERKV